MRNLLLGCVLAVTVTSCGEHEHVSPPECLVISDACHDLAETGTSALAVECHDLGHGGTAAECQARQTECLAHCVPADGGMLDSAAPDVTN